MDTEKAILNRNSVRAFVPKPVDSETIQKVLALSNQAPSGCNIQPYKLAVATGDLWRRISDEMVDLALTLENEHEIPWSLNYPDRYKLRQRRTGFGLYNVLGITREDNAGRQRQYLSNYKGFNAPGVVFVFTDTEVGEYASLDVGCWLQTFMLAATINGLGTVAQTSLAAYPQVVRKYFQVPESMALVLGVSFGYPDKSNPVNRYRPGRAPLDDMLLKDNSDLLSVTEQDNERRAV